ncbi:MAG TPA: hypothetical protein VMZ28_15780 [Kofleriaceae bacterium]|nr:hypothetical protein [Kofleriaceae bacterium]
MRGGRAALALVGLLVTTPARAQDATEGPAPEEVLPEEATDTPPLDVHGFVSQGAFISTANDYLGHSERGTAEFTEAAINLSREVADRLRVTLQLFTRDLGPIGDYRIALDLGFLDYRWRQWLGFRAGRVKMPFGLFNEVNDVPSGRTPILLPQSIYPITSRDFLLGLTGAAVYGSPQLGCAGWLDYQLFGGTIFIDDRDSPQVLEIDVRRLAGAQAFWRPPLEGLRVGGTWLNGRLDLDFQLDQATTDALIASGAAPAGFDGRAMVSLHDANLLVGSVEYSLGRVGFAAEYSRTYTHTESTPAGLVADEDSASEGFYGLVGARLDDSWAVSSYYSVKFEDIDDRTGDGAAYPIGHQAYQADLAATARYDVNEFWMLKGEAHFIQGTADLVAAENPPGKLEKNWGLFLVQTVLTF